MMFDITQSLQTWEDSPPTVVDYVERQYMYQEDIFHSQSKLAETHHIQFLTSHSLSNMYVASAKPWKTSNRQSLLKSHQNYYHLPTLTYLTLLGLHSIKNANRDPSSGSPLIPLVLSLTSQITPGVPFVSQAQFKPGDPEYWDYKPTLHTAFVILIQPGICLNLPDLDYGPP